MRKTYHQKAPAKSFFLLILYPLSLFFYGTIHAQQFDPVAGADTFEFVLSSQAREAIDNGVALTLDCEIALRQSFWLFALSREAKYHQFRIVRHALSNRYIVRRDDLQTPNIFRSIDDATGHITRQSVKLLELYNEADKTFSMRLSLNKFDLPGPMRLNAFISSAWSLNTGWISWRFVN